MEREGLRHDGQRREGKKQMSQVGRKSSRPKNWERVPTKPIKENKKEEKFEQQDKRQSEKGFGDYTYEIVDVAGPVRKSGLHTCRIRRYDGLGLQVALGTKSKVGAVRLQVFAIVDGLCVGVHMYARRERGKCESMPPEYR